MDYIIALGWQFLSRLCFLFKMFGKLPEGSSKINRISLNRCPPYTEIFSKRRKIYSVCVESLSMPPTEIRPTQIIPDFKNALLLSFPCVNTLQCQNIISSNCLKRPGVISWNIPQQIQWVLICAATIARPLAADPELSLCETPLVRPAWCRVSAWDQNDKDSRWQRGSKIGINETWRESKSISMKPNEGLLS